jgi:hypothetical protein
MDGKGYAAYILPLIAAHVGQVMAWMQDNASTHMSDDALREMAKLGIEPISWPANSPDLNPMETLWFKMERRFKAYADRLTRIQPLRDALNVILDKTRMEEVLSLADSMPERITAVIKANGGHTKYMKAQNGNCVWSK